MHLDHNEVSTKIASLEAFLLSKENKPDAALALLGDSTDPEIVKRKLGILMDLKEYEKGVALIETLPIHETWCDRAVYIFAKNGNIDKAKELIEWTKDQDNEVLKNRCRLFYVEARYSNCWIDRKEGDRIFPNTLSEKETDVLTDCLSILRPVIAKVLAERKISNEIESRAVQSSLDMHYLLNNVNEIGPLCELLFARTPTSIKIARFALSQKWLISKDKASDLAAHYTTAYPDSFEPRLNAALLLSVIVGDHQAAFSDIKLAEELMRQDYEKEELCKAAYQVAQQLDNDCLKEVVALCSKHLGAEHQLTFLVQADYHIKTANYPEAGIDLEKCRNESDPNWLQVYAEYLYRTGDRPAALRYRRLACDLMPVPELRRSTAQIAFETENYDMAIELLLQELNDNPNDTSLLNNLAATYFRKGDYKNAASYYDKLTALAPDSEMYHSNLAVCYTQAGEHEKAISAYDVLCTKDDAQLEHYLARAYLLKLIDPVKAYRSIITLKDKYWDNLKYLQLLFDLSYKAGEEECAHDVFLRLRELQRDGKAPKELLQAKTLDDLKEHAKQWNEKLRAISDHLIRGKFPWTLADQLQTHPVYMGWYIRTQSFNWCIEEPLIRAAHCIYATNCFTVYEQADKTSQLEYIKYPPKGSDIVLDISALITLHQLQLLEPLKQFSGSLFIPADYARVLLEDSDRLNVHQLSRKLSAQLIDNELKSGRIQIIGDVGTSDKRPLPFVHEHTLPADETEHYYRLVDMLTVAYECGKLPEDLFKRLNKIAQKESGVDSEHPALQKGQPILVDLMTLQSICQIDSQAMSLVPFLDTFKVNISKQDRLRNSNDLFQINRQEEIRTWNNELLTIVRDDATFKKHHYTTTHEDVDEYVSSVILAKEKELPLLADDRVLQVLAVNISKSVICPAFGTANLLFAMYKNDIINMKTLSGAYVKLMDWRYRFLVPNHRILYECSAPYKANPPGDELRRIALYLHDSLRDPGLFGGIENTTRNETMALKLLLSWIREVAYFLVDIWASTDFDEASAQRLTEWIVTQFIPSLPKYTGEQVIPVGEKIEEAVLLQYSSAMFLAENLASLIKGFHFLADCFHLDEKTYHKYVCELIDG